MYDYLGLLWLAFQTVVAGSLLLLKSFSTYFALQTINSHASIEDAYFSKIEYSGNKAYDQNQ